MGGSAVTFCWQRQCAHVHECAAVTAADRGAGGQAGRGAATHVEVLHERRRLAGLEIDAASQVGRLRQYKQSGWGEFVRGKGGVPIPYELGMGNPVRGRQQRRVC